jgi:phage host-nuclease inhibitor protein Gam
MKASIDSLGKQCRSDLTKNQDNFNQEISKMQESVKSQIKQKSDEIASITQKYDVQLTHLKNQIEESARAITLDIAQRLTSTESKLTKL